MRRAIILHLVITIWFVKREYNYGTIGMESSEIWNVLFCIIFILLVYTMGCQRVLSWRQRAHVTAHVVFDYYDVNFILCII